MEEVKSEYDIYKENSFWIYHIGPEITLTILAVLLWVSKRASMLVTTLLVTDLAIFCHHHPLSSNIIALHQPHLMSPTDKFVTHIGFYVFNI